MGIGAAIFSGINYFKIKELEKNIEIIAKSVAKVSNEVVLVQEDMVAIVGTMLRGFWRVRQALYQYNRFLEGTVQNLQFTIHHVSGLSHSVYQLSVRNYYSHIIELWVHLHLQKQRWLMDLLVEQAHTLRHGAETLVQERLPPELVPEAVLDTAIQKLSIKVRESYPHYILVTETISDYYQMKGVQSKVQDGRLYIQISVLLKTRTEPMLNLFGLQTFWVPVQNQSHLYTRVSTAADFYATVGIKHVDLMHEALLACQNIGHFRFCPNPVLQYDSTTPSCSGSLFQNLKRFDVLKQCDFDLKEREEVSPGILETKSQLVVYNAETKWKILCPEREAQERHECMLVITKETLCDCTLDIASHQVVVKVHACPHQARKIELKYHVNQAAAQAWHVLNEKLKEQHDVPYEALPEVHWPEINITHFNNSDMLQDFEQLDVDLEQLVDRVEIHKTLWISENDKIQNDLSKIRASGRFLLKNWKWLGLASGGIGAVVLAISAWGMCKMKGQMAKLVTRLPVEIVR